jgi:hypothetical protein
MSRRLVLLLPIVAAACSEDGLSRVCVTEGSGFDIEAVSALEDNWGWQGLRDAIILDGGPSAPDETWRVSEVQVLVMLPSSDFDFYDDSARLRLEVFDTAAPSGNSPYRRDETLVRSQLEWTTHTFPGEPTGGASDFFPRELTYRMAWWRFDFSAITPAEGMTSARYGVSIGWLSGDAPLVGYSRFDRSCDDNWTNYDTATPEHGLTGDGWGSNGERFTGDVCNWPMLKVSIERSVPCEE